MFIPFYMFRYAPESGFRLAVEKPHFLLFIALLWQGITFAQTPVFSFDTVRAIIERQNPEILKFEYSAGAIRAYAQGVRNWDAPQAGAGFYQTPYNPFGNPNIGFVMFSVQQMFPNPKKQAAKERWTSAGAGVEEARRLLTLHQFWNDAKLYYGEWALLKQKLQIVLKAKAALDYMIRTGENRYALGKESLSAVYKAKAEFYEWESKEQTTENEMDQKQSALNTLMARDQSGDFEIDSTFVSRDYSPPPADSQRIADARSDLRIYDRQIERQKRNIEWEESKRAPDYGARFDHMFALGNQASQFTLMGMITIPLVPWASKESAANVKGLRLEQRVLESEKNSLTNAVTGKIALLRLQIENKRHEIEHHRLKMIPAMQKSYETALIAYEQNTGDLPAVLESLHELHRMELDALETEVEMWRLRVAYERELEIF